MNEESLVIQEKLDHEDRKRGRAWGTMKEVAERQKTPEKLRHQEQSSEEFQDIAGFLGVGEEA
jgi:hypothetical protein